MYRSTYTLPPIDVALARLQGAPCYHRRQFLQQYIYVIKLGGGTERHVNTGIDSNTANEDVLPAETCQTSRSLSPNDY